MSHQDRRSGGTLIVFAREPVAGRVKTRLIPALGAEGATRLYRRLLGMALQVGRASPCTQRQLWCAGVADQAGYAGHASGDCARLAADHGFSFHRQPEGDLGVRMAAALKAALAESERAVLIGSDCPDYAPDYLAAAFAALDDHDAVLGPAADGGYVLIGLRRPAPRLFTGITWGSASVLAQTRAALREASLTWFELPTLRDLDRPEDLRHCPALLDHGLRDNQQEGSPMSPSSDRHDQLVFVYNADSGIFNTMADIGHKLFSPATYPCDLCAITHGLLSERAEWRRFIESLGAPCEFLHRDQFRARFPDVQALLPAIFRECEGRLVLCADATAIAACESLVDLQALILGHCLGER